MFKTSEIQQPPELTAYLEEVTCDPFNHYCLNCKQNQSTHFLVVMGAFICESCSNAFLKTCGGNKNCQIKNVFRDHWDDYQLRSIAFGGNQSIFNMLLANKIENVPLIINFPFYPRFLKYWSKPNLREKNYLV